MVCFEKHALVVNHFQNLPVSSLMEIVLLWKLCNHGSGDHLFFKNN